jgi:hypothetical protein
LIILDFALDADDGALAGKAQGVEAGIVTEDRATELAGAVAKIEAQERIAVGGGLHGELLDHEHGRKGSFAAGVEAFELADR